MAVSDGHLLYAADLTDGGRRDRALVEPDAPQPPDALWWLSRHGIYRAVDPPPGSERLLPRAPGEPGPPGEGSAALLHPKYGLPAHCFAYVGDPSRPASWHLPYRRADGSVDAKRLPKAILTNYRGAALGSVPERAIPAVLERLAAGARELGHMPDPRPNTAAACQLLQDALAHFERQEGVRSEAVSVIAGQQNRPPPRRSRPGTRNVALTQSMKECRRGDALRLA